MVFEDLHLPNLEERGVKQILSEKADFNSISKRGIAGNLDRKRTLMEAYKRNAREGKPGWTIRNEDRRYKTWEDVMEPQRNAVIFAMRDVSGSMGEFEAYICRSFYFWMLRFLKKKYTSAEIVFITCHTEAKEVDEHAFFGLGDSGGTKMSEAYKLAMRLIDKRYNPREWNIYPFLFSDGYNWGDTECVELVRKMTQICNQVDTGRSQTISGASRRTLRRLGRPSRSPLPPNRVSAWSRSTIERMSGQRCASSSANIRKLQA